MGGGGGVAGRFPVKGATCCRKRLPPLRAAVSPAHPSQVPFAPEPAASVHGRGSFSLLGLLLGFSTFSFVCVDGDNPVRNGAQAAQRPVYLRPPALREGVSFLKW